MTHGRTGAPAAGDPAARRRGSRVGFVTVTYSPGSTLADLLDSIPRACRDPGPVVIADNGSTDGSVEQAARRPGVTVVRTGGNIGYGAAANLGVAALDDDVTMVLISNPDVVLGEGAVDELLATADRHPQAGAVGPMITTESGEVYPSARELPSIGRGIGHALTERWWPANPWTKAYRRYDDLGTERRAGWLSGSCILVRRAAFEAIGGFDAGYFMYFEDVDLGERMTRAGWQNIYAPTARVTHLGGHTTGRHNEEMIRAHHRSAYRYLSSRYARRRHAPLRWALRLGLFARAELTRWAERRRTVRGRPAAG